MQNGGSMDFALLGILIVAAGWFLVAEVKYWNRQRRHARMIEKVKSVLGE